MDVATTLARRDKRDLNYLTPQVCAALSSLASNSVLPVTERTAYQAIAHLIGTGGLLRAGYYVQEHNRDKLAHQLRHPRSVAALEETLDTILGWTQPAGEAYGCVYSRHSSKHYVHATTPVIRISRDDDTPSCVSDLTIRTLRTTGGNVGCSVYVDGVRRILTKKFRDADFISTYFQVADPDVCELDTNLPFVSLAETRPVVPHNMKTLVKHGVVPGDKLNTVRPELIGAPSEIVRPSTADLRAIKREKDGGKVFNDCVLDGALEVVSDATRVKRAKLTDEQHDM